MDILLELIKHQSKPEQLKVVDALLKDNTLLKTLVSQTISDNKRTSQVATWVFRDYAKIQFEKTLPYLDQIIHKFCQENQHDAVYRNLGAYFSEHNFSFNEDQEGELINKAFKLLSQKASTVAIKIHCIALLEQNIRKYPELINELRFILEEQIPYSSAGFKSRATKVLKSFK